MKLAIQFAAPLLFGIVFSVCNAQEKNNRVDGYKGIWFTLGQYFGKGEGNETYAPRSTTPVFPYGDKYSGGLGTYTAKHTPLAIYSEEANKTFFVYGGTTASEERHLLCMVSYFDHTTHQVPKPVIVHDKQGVNDPHDNPSLSMDDDGYLWVFISGRARHRPGYKYRSQEPYSIDAFDQITEEEMTYPQPHYVSGKGFLNLFTKYTGVRELYFERSDDGKSWTDDQKLAGIREPGHTLGGHYQTSETIHGTTGTFFNRHPNGDVDRRTNLYYLQTKNMGRSWTTVDGKPVTVPVSEVDHESRVIDYASQKRNVYLKNMAFDQDGNPVLLYVTSAGHQPGPPNDPRTWTITRWDGNSWITSEICDADHNYDMGSLVILNDRWIVIGPTETGPQPYHGGGEVAIWESRDAGKTWSQSQQVTSKSRQNHNYVRHPQNARDPFFAFWADGDPTKLSPSHLYFCDSTGKNVWRLPYEMSGSFAKPEKVR